MQGMEWEAEARQEMIPKITCPQNWNKRISPRHFVPEPFLPQQCSLGASALHLASLACDLDLDLKMQILCVDKFRGRPDFRQNFSDDTILCRTQRPWIWSDVSRRRKDKSYANDMFMTVHRWQDTQRITGASLIVDFGSEARMPIPALQTPILPTAPLQPCARTVSYIFLESAGCSRFDYPNL